MTVKIAAKALLSDKGSKSGLVGQLFCEEGPDNITYLANVKVPIVDYSNSFTRRVDALDDAPAGDYYLQLSLPNGDVVTKRFSNEPDKETEVIIRLPHEGPHEWTTLHALQGRFREELKKTYGFTKSLDDNPISYGELRNDPESGYAVSLLTPDESGHGGFFEKGPMISEFSKTIQDSGDVKKAKVDFGGGRAVFQPTLEDAYFAVFRVAHSGVLANGERDVRNYHFHPYAPLSRHYLLQQSAVGSTLTCLPTPWTTPKGQVEVELLVKKYRLSQGLDFSLTIGDPMINTVLGYLNMGAIHKAMELVDYNYAQRMLFEKVSFPFAAAVGGYLLVFGLDRKGYRAQSDRWQEWVGNLDHWFEWLPDGAILHAALHFMLGASNKDEAFDALMRAYNRGLPFFTFGLKLMIDGMRYFASKGEVDAQKRLAELVTVANQTDPSQMFCSVTFPGIWQTNAPTTLKVSEDV